MNKLMGIEKLPNDVPLRGIGLRATKIDPTRETSWGVEQQITKDWAGKYLRSLSGKQITDWMECCNIASSLGVLGRDEESLVWAERAVLLEANSPTLFNLAYIYETFGYFDKAFEAVEAAVELDSSNHFAGLLYAESMLRRGDWKKGWETYAKYCWGNAWDELAEQRPEWKGQDVAGKRILLLPPAQGVGDLIQFLRWLKELKNQGAIVLYTCQECIVSLFEGHDWVDRLIPIANSPEAPETIIMLDEFDYFICAQGLPLVFQCTFNTIPWPGPYIRAKKKIELPRNGKPLVGYCTQAGEVNDPRRVRSLTASQTERLLDVNMVEWISLNYGSQPLIETWQDTANLIDALDLIISVDTGVMHLAGAMAKPTWTILSGRSDWKFGIGYDISPFYPTVKLFRNEGPGTEKSVQKVIQALQIIGEK